MSRKRTAGSSDAAEAAWVADEDRFVLQQSKKKALLRAKSGRATPIDWLAVTQSIVDPEFTQGAWDDDAVDAEDLEIVEPEAVFEGLDADEKGLKELEKSIEGYLVLARARSEKEYWQVSAHVTQTGGRYWKVADMKPVSH